MTAIKSEKRGRSSKPSGKGTVQNRKEVKKDPWAFGPFVGKYDLGHMGIDTDAEQRNWKRIARPLECSSCGKKTRKPIVSCVACFQRRTWEY